MIRVALLCDFAEEHWPSMDLVGRMLWEHLNTPGTGVEAVLVKPAMLRAFQGNARRLVNRFGYYPWIARRSRGFDIYHVVDHSYAQLVHCLPAAQTVVTCHDTDTFRCLLDPEREPRPLWFRAMTRLILSGLRRAAAVAAVSAATRERLVNHGVVSAERIRVIPNGVGLVFSSAKDAKWDGETERLIGPRSSAIELLHVGGTIPRKRIDVLLRVMAECGKHFPVRLIRVGGPFTEEQNALAAALKLRDAIIMVPFAETPLLAALYRRASVVLIPSEAEGFGLPLAEALASGTPVLASDIPALREVGGDAACYARTGDIPHWTENLLDLLNSRGRLDKSLLVARAKRFSWAQHARELSELYGTTLSANQLDAVSGARQIHAEKDYRYGRSRVHRVQCGEPLSSPGTQSRSH